MTVTPTSEAPDHEGLGVGLHDALQRQGVAGGAAQHGQARQDARRNWRDEYNHIYSVSVLSLSALTLDVQIYPPADGGRHVVAGDAEVGAHVLAPHPVDLQGVASPHLQSQSW